MEEQTTETQSNPRSGVNPVIPIGIVAAVVIIGAFVLATNGKKSQESINTQPTQATNEVSPTVQPTKTTGASNAAQISNESPIQVAGGNFFFKPNEIRVKKGQKVAITFTSNEGSHNFVIDEFNVTTPIIDSGKTADITFTPDKTGTFAFYCSVGNHRAMGMEGKLIVE